MFAVVKIIESEKTFLSRFKKAKIISERVFLPNGESFFIITAEAKGGKVPFEEILCFSGKLRNSLIFQNDFELQSQWNYTPWKPTELSEKLLFNFAITYLSDVKLNPLKTSICLCDSKGIYLDCVHKLLNFAAKIHIVCRNKDIYREKIFTLLCDYGASVTLSERFENSGNFNVIISHSSAELPLNFKGLIFTNEKRPFLYGRCFSFNSIDLPFEYEKLRPEGVDKLAFASALYEKCGVSEKELQPSIY